MRGVNPPASATIGQAGGGLSEKGERWIRENALVLPKMLTNVSMNAMKGKLKIMKSVNVIAIAIKRRN